MRQFNHLGNQWAVSLSGASHGIGSGRPSAIMTSFGVIFSCISDSTQGPHYGSILHESIDDETDDNLKESLDEAIVKSAQQSE